MGTIVCIKDSDTVHRYVYPRRGSLKPGCIDCGGNCTVLVDLTCTVTDSD